MQHQRRKPPERLPRANQVMKVRFEISVLIRICGEVRFIVCGIRVE
jgi:hypothetical protein